MSEERNKYRQSSTANEQGFILIVTMLVLVVLTVLCIGALDNSTFEVQIAANDRQSRVTFNQADSGLYASGKLVEETFLGDNDPDYLVNGLSYVNIPQPATSNYFSYPPVDGNVTANVVGDFHSRVQGFTDVRADNQYDFMLRTPLGLGDVFGRLTFRDIKNSDGESIETGVKATSATGTSGVSILLDMDVDAYSARNSRSNLAMRYRIKM